MILELGSKLKDYHILELLHSDAGGYREVYKAIDEGDGETVAMIVYNHSVMDSRLEMLPVLEADLNGNLCRWAFSPMSDWQEETLENGCHIEYYIVDYVMTKPVFDAQGNCTLSRNDAWNVFSTIIAGVNEIAHYAEGACHFNICPATVSFVEEDGEIRGMLSGLQFVTNDFVKNKTIDKRLIDSRYMAPEGYDGVLTPKSMQFSLAVLLATMLQGHHPWVLQNDHPQRSRCWIERMEPQVHVGEALSACLIKAIALNPEDRYETMDEFVDVVTRFCPYPLPDDYVGFGQVQYRKYPTTNESLIVDIRANLEWLHNTENGLNNESL